MKGKERKKAKENGIRCSHLRNLEEDLVIFLFLKFLCTSEVQSKYKQKFY